MDTRYQLLHCIAEAPSLPPPRSFLQTLLAACRVSATTMLSSLMLNLAGRFVQRFDVMRSTHDIFVATEVRTFHLAWMGSNVHLIAEMVSQRPAMPDNPSLLQSGLPHSLEDQQSPRARESKCHQGFLHQFHQLPMCLGKVWQVGASAPSLRTQHLSSPRQQPPLPRDDGFAALTCMRNLTIARAST